MEGVGENVFALLMVKNDFVFAVAGANAWLLSGRRTASIAMVTLRLRD